MVGWVYYVCITRYLCSYYEWDEKTMNSIQASLAIVLITGISAGTAIGLAIAEPKHQITAPVSTECTLKIGNVLVQGESYHGSK